MLQKERNLFSLSQVTLEWLPSNFLHQTRQSKGRMVTPIFIGGLFLPIRVMLAMATYFLVPK